MLTENTIIDLNTRKELFTCIHRKTILGKMNFSHRPGVNRAQFAKRIPSHPHTRQRECIKGIKEKQHRAFEVLASGKVEAAIDFQYIVVVTYHLQRIA